MNNVAQFPDYPGFSSGPASTQHTDRPGKKSEPKKTGDKVKKPNIKNSKNASKITKL